MIPGSFAGACQRITIYLILKYNYLVVWMNRCIVILSVNVKPVIPLRSLLLLHALMPLPCHTVLLDRWQHLRRLWWHPKISPSPEQIPILQQAEFANRLRALQLFARATSLVRIRIDALPGISHGPWRQALTIISMLLIERDVPQLIVFLFDTQLRLLHDQLQLLFLRWDQSWIPSWLRRLLNNLRSLR